MIRKLFMHGFIAAAMVLTTGSVEARSASVRSVEVKANQVIGGRRGITVRGIGVSVNGMKGKRFYFWAQLYQGRAKLSTRSSTYRPRFPRASYSRGHRLFFSNSAIRAKGGDPNGPITIWYYIVDEDRRRVIGKKSFRLNTSGGGRRPSGGTPAAGRRPVSHGSAGIKVEVKQTETRVIVRVYGRYQGPPATQRLTAYVAIRKSGDIVEYGRPIASPNQRIEFKWAFNKKDLGKGNFHVKGSLNNRFLKEIAVAYGKFSLGGGSGYRWRTPENGLLDINIPEAKTFGDGSKGGMTTLKFQFNNGRNTAQLKCMMYVERQKSRGRYTNKPTRIIHQPKKCNGTLYVDGKPVVSEISSFRIQSPSISREVTIEGRGKLAATIRGCAIRRVRSGSFKATFHKQAVFQMRSPSGSGQRGAFKVGSLTQELGGYLDIRKGQVQLRLYPNNRTMDVIWYRNNDGSLKAPSVSPSTWKDLFAQTGCR